MNTPQQNKNIKIAMMPLKLLQFPLVQIKHGGVNCSSAVVQIKMSSFASAYYRLPVKYRYL